MITQNITLNTNMNKKQFLELLDNAIKEPKCVVIGSATTNKDRAYGKIVYGIYIHFVGTIEGSLLEYSQDKIKIENNLEKYKKWLKTWNISNL